jgi:hypothetical protein
MIVAYEISSLRRCHLTQQSAFRMLTRVAVGRLHGRVATRAPDWRSRLAADWTQMATIASEHKAEERYVSRKSAVLLRPLCSLVDGVLELVTVRLWRISILASAGAIIIGRAAVVFLRLEFGHSGSP